MSKRIFFVLVVLSSALHVAAFAVLPRSSRAQTSHTLVPVELEPIDRPVDVPARPPPRSPPSPDPAPDLRAKAVRARVRVAKPNPAPVVTPQPNPPTAAGADEPADLTGVTMSNADGTASWSAPSGPATPYGTTVTPRSEHAAARTATRGDAPVVAATDLTSPPRPPLLDAELAANYPASARAAGITGRARVKVRVSADGHVAALRVVSQSAAGFGDACAASLRDPRWEPALARDGRAVTTDVIFTCAFEVRR